MVFGVEGLGPPHKRQQEEHPPRKGCCLAILHNRFLGNAELEISGMFGGTQEMDTRSKEDLAG